MEENHHLCSVFFVEFLSNLHLLLHFDYFSHCVLFRSASAWQTESRVFEPGLELEIFAAENIPVFGGRLVCIQVCFFLDPL